MKLCDSEIVPEVPEGRKIETDKDNGTGKTDVRVRRGSTTGGTTGMYALRR